jgi:hypothetical protein
MRLRYLAVSLLSLAAGTASAQPSNAAQAGRSPELRIDYIEDQLPNGLKVLYHVDHSTPVAAVVLWYNFFLLYTTPIQRDRTRSRITSSA